MRLIDPDKMLYHECRQLALDYTANRMQELCGWKVKPGPKKLAWFFQTRVPDGKGGAVDVRRGGGYTVHRRHKPRGWEF